MAEMQKIRVVVVDDHVIVREGLTAVLDLENDVEVVGGAGTVAEAVELFERTRPDVTIVDLRLGQESGIDVLRRIKELAPDANMLVLTAFEAEADIERALKAGARSYLLKETPREEVLAAVRLAAAGEGKLPPNIAQRVVDSYARESLTDREHEVIQLMVEGMSNRAIAEKLFVSEGTIKTHVTRILTKLDAKSRTEAVTKALRRGIARI